MALWRIYPQEHRYYGKKSKFRLCFDLPCCEENPAGWVPNIPPLVRPAHEEARTCQVLNINHIHRLVGIPRLICQAANTDIVERRRGTCIHRSITCILYSYYYHSYRSTARILRGLQLFQGRNFEAVGRRKMKGRRQTLIQHCTGHWWARVGVSVP